MSVSSVPCGALPTNPEFQVYLPVTRLFRLEIGPGRSEHPRIRVGDVGIDVLEMRMVKQVRECSRKCGVETLRDAERLSHAQVLNGDAESFERIRAGVAETSLRRHGECGRIEPLVARPVDTARGAGDGVGQPAAGLGSRGVRAGKRR